MPEDRPHLSLAMIVKNEAPRIGAFLEHHASLCDELVVVDTGSTDGTAELAAAAGARVLHFSWRDDFAAARNAALDAVRGRFALCLDADERVARSDFRKVRAAAAGPERCYLLPQRNYYDRPEHAEWQPIRGEYPEEERGQIGFFIAMNSKLVPVRADVRWSGRVHEDITPAARAAGLEIAVLHAPIHHWGYVTSAETNERRNALYGRLVRMKAEEAPADDGAAFELACVLVQDGKAREAIPVLEGLDRRDAASAPCARGRALLAKLRNEDGMRDEAGALLERALRADPGWLFSWLELARFEADAKRWGAVGALLEGARARFGDHPLVLREELRLVVNQGRIREAAPLAAKVAALFPSIPEYAALAARCSALARRLDAGE